MIIPSIDLMNGATVQLVGGRELALDAGDPLPIAERFAVVGEVAVVDLDAALGQGNNAACIEKLCGVARCRVGGGIRDYEAAKRWLERGAERIVIGTAAQPELLQRLPSDRVIAALDALDGEVVVDGWRTRTGASITERMRELRDLVDGFLVTFVEKEGRLGGTRMEAVKELVEAAGNARVTIAGGITEASEIAALDRLGADAQVGMALYTQRLELGDAFTCVLEGDGPNDAPLWPTVVVDPHGRALGQVWSSRESIRRAIAERRGIYQSRSRGLWVKGATSGATQELLAIDVDCDRDTLRFTVKQAAPGLCHQDTASCWGDLRGLPALAERLRCRAADASEQGYTSRLLRDEGLLRAKLAEEAGELAEAASRDEVIWETADVMYFAMVAMTRAGVSLSEVEAELDRRDRTVRSKGAR